MNTISSGAANDGIYHGLPAARPIMSVKSKSADWQADSRGTPGSGDAARPRLNELRREQVSTIRGFGLAGMISVLVVVPLVGAIGVTP